MKQTLEAIADRALDAITGPQSFAAMRNALLEIRRAAKETIEANHLSTADTGVWTVEEILQREG